ncbi:beta family protein [Vibrio splendidus]|uniref:beta family protein n=1 Tax=Vibrio splendidus TaxID=29497 RepID=UPI001FB54BA3|nr:beta family protein [Vibrio splendidus]UOE84272.1 beta family protein [Vibrio splendidus]UOE90272.1 beta family protein [Vibrio splendidus]
MSEYLYYPIIKTRDAELRCFSNLDDEINSQILPIYELTKSRKAKKAPDGDIHRRMKQIGEIQKGRPFILDLCTSPKYINPQIEQLIDPYNGFMDWQYFLNLYKNLDIIPMVHIYEDEESSFDDVKRFVSSVSKIKNRIAVRLPYDLDRGEYEFYLAPIIGSMHPKCSLIVLLDANYIRKEAESGIKQLIGTFVASINEVSSLPRIDDVVMLCTSFPSSPAKEGKEDAEGKFRIYEERLYQGIRESVPVKYGDYASINTEQIEMKGGTFVPRIDIALTNEFIYKRYRRGDGSYPRCAKAMLNDAEYTRLDFWPDTEILLASQDTPTGISPSFWISVRMSYYIKSRVNLRLLD